MEILFDIIDISVDFGTCLLSRLLSVVFWLAVIGTLMLKQWCVRPRLEHYYKRTHAERSKLYKRRLRDVLNDPVLVLHMESRFLKSPNIQGDRQKMLRAMEELRERATDTTCDGCSGEGGNVTKGQEKREAAKALLSWTIFFIIVLLIPLMMNVHWMLRSPNIVAVDQMSVLTSTAEVAQAVERRLMEFLSLSTLRSPNSAVRVGSNNDSDSSCGGFGLYTSCILFCFINLIHSYIMLQNTSRINRKSLNVSKQVAEPTDLEAPLLSASNDDTTHII